MFVAADQLDLNEDYTSWLVTPTRPLYSRLSSICLLIVRFSSQKDPWMKAALKQELIKGSFSLSKVRGLAHTRTLIAVNTTQSYDYSAKVFLMSQPQPAKKKDIISVSARQSLTGLFSQRDVRSVFLIV